ncbi:3'(2'),5'-bisphosphate nucleotidase CysQ [Hyphobacterium marinum]|uniref:3'(2'),5'-bisphosphate nucleotidase CysQ n=1 Tax=Hyphobacterium marinum TaxID=3116574 RepID=A0ABU7LY04_9PROT|nr:3'(2'),5'-bisphosphate nucleotidase CysQ [Hyphobacterium sp. Y6023]MEE2566441.1 3'(2'),5'-bisphosphate nucleotidase CysQ [Hyphobacterium sp. Y6023]
MKRHDRDSLAFEFARICSRASVAVMDIYGTEFTASQKADRSPVTAADHAAEAIILEELAALLPGVPILAEEAFEGGNRPEIGGEFLLVDPVDGTKEFISRNGQFTINIALISGRTPMAGCVQAPALGAIFAGGKSAFSCQGAPGAARFDWSGIAARPRPTENLTAVMSRSHRDPETEALARAEGVTETISAGSSLKFCMLAEGKADIYPRFGPTMEWDTAAGHAVLAAAGGRVENPDGTPFRYGKVETGFLNGPFIARGRA